MPERQGACGIGRLGLQMRREDCRMQHLQSTVLGIECRKPISVRRIAGKMPIEIRSAVLPPDRPPLAELPLGSIDPIPRLSLP